MPRLAQRTWQPTITFAYYKTIPIKKHFDEHSIEIIYILDDLKLQLLDLTMSAEQVCCT